MGVTMMIVVEVELQGYHYIPPTVRRRPTSPGPMASEPVILF